MVPMGFLDALFYVVPSLVYPSPTTIFPSTSFAFLFILTSSCVRTVARWRVHCNFTPTSKSTRNHENMKHVVGVFAEGVASGPSDPTSVGRVGCGKAVVPFPCFAETILLHAPSLFGRRKARTMLIGGDGMRPAGGGGAPTSLGGWV
ncbi:hypothetical protein TcCL_NonESM07170 [Trypanosoma cruzi]|nr:hypothetical protein TcCL_NonESM07170 [Trypanosoma cruzi]